MPTARPSIHTAEESQVKAFGQNESVVTHDSSVNEKSAESNLESGSDFEQEFDESSQNSPENLRRERFEISRSVPRTPQRPKRKPQRENVPIYEPESFGVKTERSSSNLSTYVLTGLVVLVLASIVFALNDVDVPSKTYTQCSYEQMEKQYPHISKMVWNTLRSGIEQTVNKLNKQSVTYLFVHHGGDHIYGIVKDIALHSSSCFGQSKGLVEMENNDFTSDQTIEDYGHAIEKYKMKIQQGNVVLIANLNEIPPKAAKAFHTICDTYSPIDLYVVTFMTLVIPRSKEGNLQSITETALADLWGSGLKDNELNPLITRVADQVLFLNNDVE